MPCAYQRKKRRPPPFPFKGALFDLDGTLVETERLLYKAWVILGKRLGVDFRTFEYARVIGKPDITCCRIIIRHFRLRCDPVELHEEYQAEMRVLMDRELEMRDGAYQALHAFRKRRIPMALVTSSREEHVDVALGRFGLKMFFDAIITADHPELRRRKPAPDPYRLGAKKLGLKARDCVAFEDSPAGVLSAKRAGAYVVAVAHAHSPESGLTEADLILEDMTQFKLSLLY